MKSVIEGTCIVNRLKNINIPLSLLCNIDAELAKELQQPQYKEHLQRWTGMSWYNVNSFDSGLNVYRLSPDFQIKHYYCNNRHILSNEKCNCHIEVPISEINYIIGILAIAKTTNLDLNKYVFRKGVMPFDVVLNNNGKDSIPDANDFPDTYAFVKKPQVK